MIVNRTCILFILSFVTGFLPTSVAQDHAGFRIIGYYSGPTASIDSFETEKLTHLIFCFGHLDGNRFHIGSAGDSATINKMVELKRLNPKLKVILLVDGVDAIPALMFLAQAQVVGNLHNRSKRLLHISGPMELIWIGSIRLYKDFPAIGIAPKTALILQLCSRSCETSMAMTSN